MDIIYTCIPGTFWYHILYLAEVRKKQGFSWFIDGKVSMMMTGRDGTENRRQNGTVVPSRRQFHLPLTRTVPSRRENLSRSTLPSRPVEEISMYCPVPWTKRAPTVPSRRQNLPQPSRPVVKTCPYRPVPPSKPVSTVESRRLYPSLPSLSAIHCHHLFPSRCRVCQDAVNTINS